MRDVAPPEACRDLTGVHGSRDYVTPAPPNFLIPLPLDSAALTLPSELTPQPRRPDRRTLLESPQTRIPGRLDLLVQLESTRPAFAAGVRASMATVVPLLLGYFLHLPAMDWASVAGFSASLVDKGGSYQSRAQAMGLFTAAGALSVVVAATAGLHPSLAVVLMCLWAAGGTLVQAYGATGASVGPSIALVFLASLAAPLPLAGGLERMAYFVGGGLWAMVLALILWPLRPYRPARLAVGGVFQSLAEYAAAIGSETRTRRHRVRRPPIAETQQAQIRNAIEAGRSALVAMRRGRQAEGRCERLLVLLEAADLSFATLVAIDDVLESAPLGDAFVGARNSALQAVSAFVGTARDIALVVETEGRSLIALPIVWGPERLTAALDAGVSQTTALEQAAHAAAQYGFAADLIGRLREYSGVASEAASSIEDEAAPPIAAIGTSFAVEPVRSIFAPLRETLSFRSAELRHALRVGLVTGAAVWITRGFALPHGTWVTTTAIVILQPQVGLTLVKGVQRVIGTVLGGVLTAALGAAIHDPFGILILAFMFSALCVAVLPINYGVYSIFLTPALVLVEEASAGDWHLGWVRIVNTLIGGALAFIGSRLLWLTSERDRFPEELAAALRANANYLRHAIGSTRDDVSDDRALSEARRALGLAATNAESSFQRLLAERRGSAQKLEPAMTVLAYTQRFAAAVTALMPPRTLGGAATQRESLAPFVAAAVEALDTMAQALAEDRPPPPLPDLDQLAAHDDRGAGDDSRLTAHLDRVVRQLIILHRAVTRAYYAGSNSRRTIASDRRDHGSHESAAAPATSASHLGGG
ncbi:MAG: hypothetical protein NVS4B3_02000 [Gemmatimonadaceae bacterium]